MIWKTLPTGLTGLDPSAFSTVMDSRGYPHCLWQEGRTMRFARFMGAKWEYLGDREIALSIEADFTLPPNALALSPDLTPFATYVSDGKVMCAYWDGIAWQTEIVFDAQAYGLVGWSIAYKETSYVVVLINATSKFMLKMFRKDIAWGEVASFDLPIQENVDPMIQMKVVEQSMYVFWKVVVGSESWIGHMAYDVDSASWYGMPLSRIEISKSDSMVTGFDFIADDESWSSSSSESSSESSMTS